MSIHELQAALTAVKEKREALRAAVEAGSGMVAASTLLHDAQHALEAAARRVAEGAGEPVAWQRRLSRGNYVSSWQECGAENRHDDRADGWVREYRPLYTTPTSADALVEALGKLSAEGNALMSTRDDYHDGMRMGRELCADDLDTAPAKHKENTE